MFFLSDESLVFLILPFVILPFSFENFKFQILNFVISYFRRRDLGKRTSENENRSAQNPALRRDFGFPELAIFNSLV